MKNLLLSLSVCSTLFAIPTKASDYSLLDTSLDCNDCNARLTHRKTPSNSIGADPCIYEINDKKYEDHGRYNALTVETCDVAPEHALLVTKFNVLPQNKSLIRALNNFFISIANAKDPRKKYTTVYAWVSKMDVNGEESLMYLMLKKRFSFQEDLTVIKGSVNNVKIPIPAGMIQLKVTMENVKSSLITKN